MEADAKLQGHILELRAELLQSSEREAALAGELRAALAQGAERTAAADLSRTHEVEAKTQVCVGAIP